MSVFNIAHDHQLPTSALIKFCGAKVDPYTNYVASIMLKSLKLSVQGQRNINTALSNLPYFYVADERLAFGWSLDSFVRSEAVHRNGYEHLGVMVALSATFHESYAAEVLHAMAVLRAGADDMTPHVRQFRNQLRSCNGLFSAYDFDILVEDYIRLDPCSIGPGSNLVGRRCLVSPKDMAKGLMAIAEVTSGRQKQITLLGGAVIGWCAALCEWFYDLRTIVYAPNGDYLHGHTLKQDAQVILIYTPSPILKVHADNVDMAFKDTVEKETDAYSRSVHFLPFGGRVVWQSLLPRIFGEAFHQLDHERSNELFTIIGAVARALEGGVTEVKDDTLITPQNRTNAAAYGAGLIQNITAWLPELRKGQGLMTRQLRKSFKDAGDLYDEYMEKIESRCQCTTCSVPSDEKAPPRDQYCLAVIVETIISLGLAISRMIVSPGIYPTREGLQALYHDQSERKSQAKHMPRGSLARFQTTYGNEWNASDSRRLQNAVTIFSGRRPTLDIPDTLIAISHEGMCAYMVELWKSDARKQTQGREGLIQIVSGCINVKDKFFTRMSTEPAREEEGFEDWSWEELQFDNCTKPMYLK